MIHQTIILLLESGWKKVVGTWPFLIGRDVAHTHFPVPSSSIVSSAHAFLTLTRDGAVGAADARAAAADALLYITDTSYTGTFVNCVRIGSRQRQVALVHGDRVAFTDRSIQTCPTEHLFEAFVVQEELPSTQDTAEPRLKRIKSHATLEPTQNINYNHEIARMFHLSGSAI